jgi:hypothetical protein
LSKDMPEYLRIEQKDGSYILKGFIDRCSYGIFYHCYSQPISFVTEVLEDTVPEDYSSLNKEDQNDGQRTVDILRLILHAIPGLEVIQSGHKSVADCRLLWDVILKWKGFAFPIQVKTSPKGIGKAVRNDSDSMMSGYANKKIELLDKMQSCVCDERDFRERINLYENSAPLYLWIDSKHWTNRKNNSPEDSIRKMVRLFAECFDMSSGIKEYEDRAVQSFKAQYLSQSIKTYSLVGTIGHLKTTRESKLGDITAINLGLGNQKFGQDQPANQAFRRAGKDTTEAKRKPDCSIPEVKTDSKPIVPRPIPRITSTPHSAPAATGTPSTTPGQPTLPQT